MEQLSISQALQALQTDAQAGLSQREAEDRLARFGPNELKEEQPKTLVQMFLGQIQDPMIYILLAAVAVSLALSEFGDALIILSVIVINAVIGVVQESRAEQSLEALKQLASPLAMVRRDGNVLEVPARDLVQGDIVLLEAGRIVPADLRLLQTANLRIEESALTGESVASEKDASFIATDDLPLGDRINMAYAGTSVAYGRGEGAVCCTGMETEVGKIARMIQQTGTELTPLQKRLADLGRVLGVVAVALCVGLFAVALLQQRNAVEMLLTAIALAVAAIPEGLPAVVTIVLALGVQRMVKVNTIVRRLPAVETLGSVSVVCSDKTGTLTQNKMTVTRLYANGRAVEASDASYEEYRTLIDGMALCCDAHVDEEHRVGDPTELALVDLALSLGVTKEGLEQLQPRINEQPFDSVRKMMTTVHRDADGLVTSYTKGATDDILCRSMEILSDGEIRSLTDDDRLQIGKAANDMASGALRVLALAIRRENEEANESDLIFVGLVGMIDPPRPEAAEAVRIFREAHVMTVMITGDHKETALAIARELGIAQSMEECISGEELERLTQEELEARVDQLRVFARVSPEHKVRIVSAYRSRGHIVAMTGDGVNDAPSLGTADIGIAMGITGTDVAKSASDMVLADDNFASIEKAIYEGRVIYHNIRKTVWFLLSSNFGEVITMCSAIVAGLFSPLKAIHILWVNLITDALPALGLGVDGGSAHLMQEPPRDPDEHLFARGGLFTTLLFGLTIAVITLGAFLIVPLERLLASGTAISIKNINEVTSQAGVYMRCQTYAFTTLGVSQLFHAVGMRDVDVSVFRMSYRDNRMLLFALAFGLCLQIAVTEWPVFVQVFGTAELSLAEWLRLLALSSVPLWIHELRILLRKPFAAVRSRMWMSSS